MRVMDVEDIYRRATPVIIGTVLRHKKNTTPTKYQKTPLMFVGERRPITSGLEGGILIKTHHSNPATVFFTIVIVGKLGTKTTATIWND